MFCARSCTKALMPLVSAPLALLQMVVVYFLVTLFDVVISIVIPISRMVVFTSLTFALFSAPDRIVTAYIGFRIQHKCKKLETKMLLMICTRSST